MRNSLSRDFTIAFVFNDHHVEAISVPFPQPESEPLTPESSTACPLLLGAVVSTIGNGFLPCLYALAVGTVGSGPRGLVEALGEEMASPWILRC